MKLPLKTFSVLLLAVLGPGCLERTLRIDSDPRGALVYLADEEIGRTPLTVDFTWYGDYEVTLRREGSRTLHTHRRIATPAWEYPPVDLLCELMPWRIANHVEWDFELQPASPALDEALIDRARELSGAMDSQ